MPLVSKLRSERSVHLRRRERRRSQRGTQWRSRELRDQRRQLACRDGALGGHGGRHVFAHVRVGRAGPAFTEWSDRCHARRGLERGASREWRRIRGEPGVVARRQHDRLRLPGGRGERRHLRRACRRHGLRQAHDRCGTRLRCRMEAGRLAARVRYHPFRYGRNRAHEFRRHRGHADRQRACGVGAGLVGRRIAVRVRALRRGLRLLRLLHVPGDLRGAGGRRQRQSGHVRERGSQPGVEATSMSRHPAAAWPTVCAVVLLGGAAAWHDAIVGSGPAPPSLSAVAVAANPLNALSVVATFDIQRADSARLSYWSNGEAVATTPYYAVGAGPARLVALGLLPNTGYHFAIAAVGPGGAIASDTLAYRTAGLPEILQGVQVSIG